MRFVLAIVSFVLAALMIGWGIGQRTILAGPESATSSVRTEAAPLTVVDGEAVEQLGIELDALSPSRSMTVSGEGELLVAYGRTVDVLAWVGDTDHNLVTADLESGELVSELVTGAESEAPDPRGSDLWFDEVDGVDAVELTSGVRSDMSVLLATDGTAPAPDAISVQWPIDDSTPYAVPLIVAGSVMLVLGLALYIWALVHLRRGQGPRRKTAKQPKGPKPPRRPKPGVLGAGRPPGPQLESPRGRRATRKRIALLPAGIAVAALAGCTGTPSLDVDASPSPSASESAGPAVEPPVVTQAQAERILAQVAEVGAAADEARDADAASARFDGAALDERRGYYALLAAEAEEPAPPVIPASVVEVTLPQATEAWPRTVFAVLRDEADAEASQVAVVLTQNSPRENYKVQYAVAFAPGAQFPDVAPASIGAARLSPDDQLLAVPPSQLGAAYGDVLINGDSSGSAGLFSEEADGLRTQIGQQNRQDTRDALGENGTFDTRIEAGTGETIALATNDAGAIVAVSLKDVYEVKPVDSGEINLGETTAAVLDKESTTTGVRSTYGLQLLFAVPPSTAADQTVRVLGYSNGFLEASELE
ncbi:hypothetical protein [Arenivirga flava]|uniref:DUF8094 domain-containing protein n=1 Tax=Arenivirga flava TaxID=1930060 RepID=A0AA37UPL7_9MICO|nr:hypothetical protein [Arenivirga flava]GMA29615.1 hypothetical protein GCM10025874_28680 [Arenivirga flava]